MICFDEQDRASKYTEFETAILERAKLYAVMSEKIKNLDINRLEEEIEKMKKEVPWLFKDASDTQ